MMIHSMATSRRVLAKGPAVRDGSQTMTGEFR